MEVDEPVAAAEGSPPPVNAEAGASTSSGIPPATDPASSKVDSHPRRHARPEDALPVYKPRDPLIRAGDLIIMYISRNMNPLPVTVTPGETWSNSFGHFYHADMIGRPFGSRIYARNSKKPAYVTALRPDPQWWTLSLPHRTQILYATDIAFITDLLGLGPGSRVIEAGTGSGSMTHSLARTVGRADQWSAWKGDRTDLNSSRARGVRPRREEPMGSDGENTPGPSTPAKGEAALSETEAAAAVTPEILSDTEAGLPVPETDGRVWSFEFHRERAGKARIEFAAHGLSRIVTLNHRNVCKYGFGLPPSANAEAVFLDLPAPWEAIPWTLGCLNRSRRTRICCFSPCIEQVLRTVTALYNHGFVEVATYESLTRVHDPFFVKEGPVIRSIAEIVERLKSIERKKETKREWQIEKSKEARRLKTLEAEAQAEGKVEPAQEDVQEGVKRGREVEAIEEVGNDQGKPDRVVKRARLDSDHAAAPAQNDTRGDGAAPAAINGEGERAATPKSAPLATNGNPSKRIKVPSVAGRDYTLARPQAEMRGHTSYLTFATLLPRSEIGPISRVAGKDGRAG